MKLACNKVLSGKQIIRYNLLKNQTYLNYEKISENTQNTRTKHCIINLNRIELKLKRSLMMVNYYHINRNIILFIGLPTRWNKVFNRFLSKKDNCFLFFINKKRFSKLTSDQFTFILNQRFLNARIKKPLLIVNFWETWDYNTNIPDIPVINFDNTNKFTLSLLGSSLSSKFINTNAKYI